MKLLQMFCVVSWFLFGCVCAIAEAQPDKQYFLIQPKDAAIARIYTGLLDRDIEQALLSFNPDSGLVQVQMPVDSIRQNHDSVYAAYKQTVELMGALGYAYSLNASKYHQSPLILQHLRTIFKTLEDNPLTHEDEYLLLEAWMTAFISVQNDLSANERIRTLKIINAQLDEMLKQEPGYDDSRGVVWCGVMAVASRFNGNPLYMAAAERKLQSIVPIIFQEDGQVLEGNAPELNRSLTSLQYLFLFRIMNGNNDWDTIIHRSLNWATLLFSFHGIPLAMNRSAMNKTDNHAISKLMSALTYYGQKDNPLNQTAARYLEALIAVEPGFTLKNSVGHFLRGMAYHTIPESLHTIPYPLYSKLYTTEQSVYYTTGRNYQTLVTLQSPHDFHGLQTWSYQGQAPVIMAAPKTPSCVISMGMDSARLHTGHESEPAYLITSVTQGVDTLVYQQNGLISGFVFSNDLTVVVYRDENGSGRVDWVIAQPDGAQMTDIEKSAIQFSNTVAKIFLPPIELVLMQNDTNLTLRFPYKSEMVWFTFAGPESIAVVQPVIDGIVLIQLNEADKKTNLVINLSTKAFQTEMNFPGTDIAVPHIQPFGATVIHSK